MWHTGGNGGLSVGVGLQAYHFLKCSQIPRYGFNGGSHARLWLGSAARNARDARFRDRFSASLAALASLVPRSEPPPAAGRCFGSCGRSVPIPGGYPSRDSSSASAASVPPDERLGTFFKILCLAPVLDTCFMWNRTKEIVLSNCGTLGATAVFLLGWGCRPTIS